MFFQTLVFIHLLDNPKLLILFNQINITVGKTLVKHIYSLVLLITVLKHVEKFKMGNSTKEVLSILS